MHNNKINSDNQELQPKKNRPPLLVASYLGVTFTNKIKEAARRLGFILHPNKK